ncbi:ABC transporter substrate-binding protein [Vreelandella olivaria]|uniref:ABC transporter substrate-binding protein n=1 Tax=Vreelandella olivaria TaxID=390919 RepID=UPI00201F3C7B|nr:ABC transporter substrate-binding protein [Halomonas olivaria]
MLHSISRSWPLVLLALCLLFSNSIVYANEENNEEALTTEILSLESEVVVPETFWQPPEDSIDEAAPTMALIPPPPLEPPPLKQLTLMLDWYLSPQHAALIVAQERGLFAAQGLEVELQTPADPSIAIKLLAAGEVDLALSRQPLLHLNAHDGVPVSRIGTLFETPLNAVIVAGSEQIEDTPTLLAGLHYGFATREGRDVVIERLLPRSIRQTDGFLPPESVHFDAASPLREGRIDAIADGYFHYLPPQLATEGITTHVIQYHDVEIPHHDGLIVLANSDSVIRRAPTWARFLIALEEASYWIIDNPDAAWTLLATSHPVLDNTINAAAWEDLLRRMALSPAALDARRYKAFESFLLQNGLIDEVLPISRLAIDPHSL